MLNLLNQVVIASLAKQTQSSGTLTEAVASLEHWRAEKYESQRPLVATLFQMVLNNDVIFSYDPTNSLNAHVQFNEKRYRRMVTVTSL